MAAKTSEAQIDLATGRRTPLELFKRMIPGKRVKGNYVVLQIWLFQHRYNAYPAGYNAYPGWQKLAAVWGGQNGHEIFRTVHICYFAHNCNLIQI